MIQVNEEVFIDPAEVCAILPFAGQDGKAQDGAAVMLLKVTGLRVVVNTHSPLSLYTLLFGARQKMN